MKVAVFLVLAALCTCVLSQYSHHDPEFIKAFNRTYEWDVIFANNTSYLDEIDAHRGRIYVAGGGEVREINEDPFEISYHHEFFRQRHSFLDFKAFVHDNHTWVIGPVDPYGINGSAIGVQHGYGLSHPIQIANMEEEDISRNYPLGQQIAAIAATYMEDHVVVYGAGWRLRTEFDRTSINFGIYRMRIHPGHTRHHNGSFISTDTYFDHISFDDHGYIEYSRNYKPWVFHSSYYQHVIVVDPATRTIYKVHAPNNTNITMERRSQTYAGFSHSNITSAIFDHETQYLYIGTRSNGWQAGTITCIDTTHEPMITLFTTTLHEFESNPRALDLHNGTLYVGLSGGGVIMKLNVHNNGQVIGYTTLPWYVREVSSIHVTNHHVYVVTNEQYAKVARTSHRNFCETPCDYFYGYCDHGKCACHPSHTLGSNGRSCEPNVATAKAGHGGEIALGLLFTISFIAALFGWFAVFRMRQGKPVPFISGTPGRYSLVHATEEKTGFLDDN